MNTKYDFDTKYKEYCQWYPNSYANTESNKNLCKRWAEWIDSIPRDTELPLSNFLNSLEESERMEIETGLVKGSPVIPIMVDLDCIIRDLSTNPFIYKLIEQPTDVCFHN